MINCFKKGVKLKAHTSSKNFFLSNKFFSLRSIFFSSLFISTPIFSNSLQTKVSPRKIDQIKPIFNLEGPVRINSGNPKKQLQMMALAYQHDIPIESITTKDLKEIDSTALNVIVHKASQFSDKVIVSDSSLDVEGAKVGVNLKWMISKLDRFVGKKATLTTLLAYKEKTGTNEQVLVFRGQRKGVLVSPRGPSQKGCPLNRYFQPNGSCKTLAERGGREFDPTNIAFKDMVRGKTFKVTVPLKAWSGPWQKES